MKFSLRWCVGKRREQLQNFSLIARSSRLDTAFFEHPCWDLHARGSYHRRRHLHNFSFSHRLTSECRSGRTHGNRMHNAKSSISRQGRFRSVIRSERTHRSNRCFFLDRWGGNGLWLNSIDDCSGFWRFSLLSAGRHFQRLSSR